MKIKKLFIVLTCLIFLIVPFSISSVSAAEAVFTETVDVGFGDFEISQVGVIASNSNGWIDIKDVTFLKFDTNNRVRVNIIPEGDHFTHKDTVRVFLVIRPLKKDYLSKSLNTVGAFSVGMKNGGMKNLKFDTDLGDCRRSSSETYDSQYPKTEDIVTDWGTRKRFHYSDRTIGDVFDEYYVYLEYTVVNTGYDYSRYIYVQDFNFESMTETEYKQKELNAVIGPNVDRIIENQNDNFDKLINGGTDYGTVDKGAVNDYGSVEGELNSATQNAQSDSISFFNNFGNLFQSSHLHKGLLAVSAITKEFFAIDWMSDLLSFGLGLGAFAFILGTATLVLNFSVRKEEKKNRSAVSLERAKARSAKARAARNRFKGGGG